MKPRLHPTIVAEEPGLTKRINVANRSAARKSDANRPHRYEDYCPVSRALEIVGDRWTLLLIVELLFMPKRYTDLLESLSGISSNLLASRLKMLEGRGVVRKRRLPPPAASTVYELTERGRLLEPVAYALGNFGSHYLEAPTKDLTVGLETWLFGLRLAFKRELAEGVKEIYELHVDDHPPVQVCVRDGELSVSVDPLQEPDVVITSTTATLVALSMRLLSPTRAIRDQAVRMSGDRSAFRRFVSLFEMPAPADDEARKGRSRRRVRPTG
jgi:DNA-binding HxlR family transcriptional regulator